ncbi:ABC transporter permease [Lactococcus nasutitermitis]|uniref:ABC transporter permease n=1 Tax=Lactococcus nasutitermitis TaxID=1652957 RepID=A0ABV9JFC0_9LACT|nr:ABC transporter permease [Lactococcus nasutitermitis]
MKRNLKKNLRDGEAIITSLVMPLVIFMINYFVARQQGDSGAALGQIFPVVAIVSVLLGTSYTAFRLFEDREKNMMTRLRSMPLARGAFLWGHVLTNVIQTFVSISLITGLAFLLGLTSPANLGHWALFYVGLLLFSFSTAWAMTILGFVAKSMGMLSALFMLVMGFFILSSEMMGTMILFELPQFVQNIAEFHPANFIINGLSHTLQQGTIHADFGIGLLMSTGILVVSYLVSTRLYKRSRV